MRWHALCFAFMLTWVLAHGQRLIYTPPFQSVPENTAGLLFSGNYSDSTCNITSVTQQATIPGVRLNSTVPVLQPWTFNVNLEQPLDREQLAPDYSFSVSVRASVSCGGPVIEQGPNNVLIIVLDVKDTPPSFLKRVYQVYVYENTTVNTTVVSNITATDPDDRDTVSYTINFQDYQRSMFDGRHPIAPELLDIYLISELDFETQRSHSFTVTANDTVGMNGTCEVTIDVVNIQDTAPAFTALQYNGRVTEGAPHGTTVLTVTAIDGDSAPQQSPGDTAANDIEYSITTGGAGMFHINSTTGAITTVGVLDIDNNTQVTNGLVVLTVLAKELNTSGQANTGISTAEVQVLIQIEDANDNTPQFNAATYSGTIREDAVEGELVTIEGGGYISVFDIDQAPSNNHFTISIEREGQPWNLFKPNIESQYSQASLLILLNQGEGLMGQGNSHLTFQIVAQDTGNHSFPPTKAEMTVWIIAHTTPAPTQEPVINLPLTTSDIIVFVVGILLLLNVGLTIFVCYVMRRGKGGGSGGGSGDGFTVFSRNSKYYVSDSSKRRAESESANTEIRNGTAGGRRDAKLESGETRTVAKIEDPPAVATTTTVTNTVAAAANRNRCDVTPLEDRYTTSLAAAGKKTSGTKDAQERTQVALLDILNEGQSASRSDVTHVKTSAPTTSANPLKVGDNQSNNKDTKVRKDHDYTDGLSPEERKAKSDNKGDSSTTGTSQERCDIIPIDQSPHALGQGLSNLLQKVHNKLSQAPKFEKDKTSDITDVQPLYKTSPSHDSSLNHSNSSSISERATTDVVPLITSSPSKSRTVKANLEGHQNPAFGHVDSKDSGKHKGKGKQKDLDYQQNFTLLPSENSEQLYNTSSANKPDLASSVASSFPAVYPEGEQITKTGVPPIALALPSTGGILNNEPSIMVTNPVYGSSTKQNTNKQNPPRTESSAPGTTAASTVLTTSTIPKSTRPQSPSTSGKSQSESATTTKPSVSVAKPSTAPTNVVSVSSPSAVKVSPTASANLQATKPPTTSSVHNTTAPSTALKSTTPTTTNNPTTSATFEVNAVPKNSTSLLQAGKTSSSPTPVNKEPLTSPVAKSTTLATSGGQLSPQLTSSTHKASPTPDTSSAAPALSSFTTSSEPPENKTSAPNNIPTPKSSPPIVLSKPTVPSITSTTTNPVQSTVKKSPAPGVPSTSTSSPSTSTSSPSTTTSAQPSNTSLAKQNLSQSPPAPKPSGMSKNLPTDVTPRTKDKATLTDDMNKAALNAAEASSPTSDRNPPLSPRDSLINEMKQLHRSASNFPLDDRETKSAPNLDRNELSNSRDYVAAAKNLLSSAKQDSKQRGTSVANTPSTQQKSDDAKGKDQEKLTSF